MTLTEWVRSVNGVKISTLGLEPEFPHADAVTVVHRPLLNTKEDRARYDLADYDMWNDHGPRLTVFRPKPRPGSELNRRLAALFPGRTGPASAGDSTWGLVRTPGTDRGVTYGADINDSRAFVAFVTNESDAVEDSADWEVLDNRSGKPIQITVPMAADDVGRGVPGPTALAVAVVRHLVALVEANKP